MHKPNTFRAPPGFEHCSSDDVRQEIERLLPSAETGAQWAEICRLEDIAVTMERGGAFDEAGVPVSARRI